MANSKKTLEADKIIKSLSVEQVSGLHATRGMKNFKFLVEVFNNILLNDKDKIVGLVSDINASDEAIRQTSKQNFYRGRINAIVLIHSLMSKAEKELERREKNGS